MEQAISVWGLVKLDLFEQACLKADNEFIEKGNLTSLRNKVYALFNLKKYEAIVRLENDIISMDGKSACDFISLGIALWILNKKNDAIKNWKKAVKTPYQDAAGGLDVYLLLYFSSIKMKNEELKLETVKSIKKLSKNNRDINWPAPLADYVLDKIDELGLLKYIDHDIPILKERQLCLMDFVIGVKYLEKGDDLNYLRKLKDCTSYGPNSYLESFLYLAKGELEDPI